MTKTKQRVEWIDAARGLFMIFIVCFHYENTPVLFVRIVYTFTMSFFFFVSGMFFSGKQQSFLFFAFNNLGKFLPLIIINAVLTLLKNVLISGFSFEYVKYMLKSLVFQVYGCESLWFLACNFCCLIIMYLITKITKKPENVILICIFLSILGGFFTYCVDLPLPWNIDIAFIQMLFMGMGYYYKNNSKMIDNKISKSVVFLFIVYAACVYLNPYCDIHRREYSNIFIYYVQAFIGVILVVFVFKRVFNKSIKVLSYLGKNSLFVYAFHGYCIIIYNRIENLLHLSKTMKQLIVIKSFLTIGVAIFTSITMYIGVKMYYLIKEKIRNKFKKANDIA